MLSESVCVADYASKASSTCQTKRGFGRSVRGVSPSKVVRRNHKGCNILLNNGKYAEQYIKHLHFHVIPRDRGDGLKLVSWKEKRLSKNKFEKLSKVL